MFRNLDRSKAAQRHTVRLTAVFVIFVCLSMLVIDVWLAFRARQLELKQALVSNSNLASAVAQQMGGMVSEVGNLLSAIAFEFESETNGSAKHEHLQAILKHHAASNKHIHGLFVYDAEGAWRLTSQATIPAGANNSDRDYFIHHRADVSLTTRIGKPILSRSTGVWIIPVSRRINDRSGSFAGVLLATISVAHVSQMLDVFDIGEKGSLTLTLEDGTIIVRRPFSQETLGKALMSGDLLEQFASYAAGSFEVLSPIDGVQRMGSFQHTQDHPLLVIVALSKDELLREWRETTGLQTLWILLLCIVTGLAGMYVIRSVRQRVKAEMHLGRTRDELTSANGKLARLARYDGLTGLANRRFLDEILERSFAESSSTGKPLGLVMFDIDHFKSYNDLYGHQKGDKCLQQVAKAIESVVRKPSDFVARYGGEEFVMLLPDTDLEGAKRVAEAARKAIEELAVPHDGSQSKTVSVSAGIAVYTPPEDVQRVRDLLLQADQALYHAKKTGRNTVSIGMEKMDVEAKA